jgi:alanine dehydrogenase
VAALLDLDECIAAVERAFLLHANGKTLPPGVLGVPARGGGFHIKAAGMDMGRAYFAAKVNANFPLNTQRFGLPTIQGIIVLCDAATGYPLAIMDSIEITSFRTGAAPAVAAKYLARPDAALATICGCGVQARAQLRALMRVRPLERSYAFDLDGRQAEQFARELSEEFRIEVRAVRDLPAAVRQSDICVTCTPSRQFFLRHEDGAPGTFIAAVGADSPEKQELEPVLLASSKVVVDLLEQCATMGELHHALTGGWVRREDVHAELAEVIPGRRVGRTSAEEITLFDSTGTALQDVAAAVVVYEKAVAAGRGRTVDLAG